MDRATNQPRVFISSTISDFRDLRSALKFWLEELGLRVLLSEFNDFDRRPDQGTFASCFEAISTCHYFVLLIGSKRGSFYSAGVSVTQQEYRVAARLAQEGHIKPVIFVRSEVLQALREFRKAVNEPPREAEVAEQTEIDFVRQFVDEIRATEIGRQGENPSGTLWTYQFDDFRDLVDALRVNLRLFGALRRKALLENLAWELRENISIFCENHQGAPDCGLDHAEPLRRLQGEGLRGPARFIKLDRNQSAALMRFIVSGMPLESALRTSALQEAVSSGEFLEFNSAEERLVRSPELEAMLALHRDYERYRALSRWQQQLTEGLNRQWNERQQITVDSATLGFFVAAPDFVRNILRESLSLLDFAASDGTDFEPPDLIALAPFGEEVQRRAAEARPAQELVEAWRIDAELRRLLTGEQ
jgi:hypothetical protein